MPSITSCLTPSVIKLQQSFSIDFYTLPELYLLCYCALRAIKVAGLVNPLLDIYFPTTLFSRAPKYFSKRAPYRIVSVCGGGERWGGGKKKKANRRSKTAGSEDALKVILGQIFLTDAETQQAEPAAPLSPVSLGHIFFSEVWVERALSEVGSATKRK